MKKLLVFLCALAMVFGTVGTVGATLITVDLEQNPGGFPIGGSPYGSAALSYYSSGPTFMGSLSVAGLTNGMTYQMKIEGQPGDDPTGNLNLGSIGRWWVVDLTAGPWQGFNTTDAGYQNYIDAGYTVKGYCLFDSFTYSGNPLTIPIYLDSSYHTAGLPQPDRPAPGDVVMPYGDYTVTFLLTENNGPWGSPLLKSDISFSVAPVPEPATMLLLGSGLIGLAGLGRKKFFKKS